MAAGAVARQILGLENIIVSAYTIALGGIETAKRQFSEILENRLYCPDNEAAARMEERIAEVRRQGDSLGGIVEIRATGSLVGGS